MTDREAWRAAIHGVAKSRTRLSDGTDYYFQVALVVKNLSANAEDVRDVPSPLLFMYLFEFLSAQNHV